MPDQARPGPGFAAALRRLLAALPPRRTRQLAGLTLLAVAAAAAELAVVASAMAFVAGLVGQPLPASLKRLLPTIAGLSPTQLALGFAACMTLANLIRLAALRASEGFIAAAGHELAVDAQRRLLAQPYAFHVGFRSSEALAALDKVGVAVTMLVQHWLQSATALATGIALAVLLARLDPLPALAAFAALGLIYVIVARLAAARLQRNSRLLGQTYSARFASIQQSLGAIRDLKLDHAEAAQVAAFRAIDADFAAARASNAVLVAAPRFLVEIGAVLLIAGLVAWLTASGGAARAVPLIVGVGLGGLRLLPLAQTAYRNWATLKGNRAALDDVFTVLDLPVAVEQAAPAPLPFRDVLSLRDVGLHYPGRGEPVLSNVSLDIARGERIALVGETGSGKSTLADLIMGLLTPDNGTIAVDGTVLDGDRARGWQRNIGHVAQHIFLVDSTIAANIAFSRPGEPIDQARLAAAVAGAELADFIASLPNGLETMVGERGVQLSGGQRQRIGIARALYKGAPVLVLDEATNALDEATEDKVLANLWADPERTILLIAHRPSAIAKCSRVIRITNGSAVTEQ